MFLQDRTREGWIVACDCANGSPFTAKRLGIAVECPRCGRTALSADLATEYWLRTDAQDVAVLA